MQSKRLILTPVEQVKPEQHVSPDALLEPQSPFKVAHALTDIDDAKAATTARRNEKRIARVRLYGMCQ